jgi:hypothetical protein
MPCSSAFVRCGPCRSDTQVVGVPGRTLRAGLHRLRRILPLVPLSQLGDAVRDVRLRKVTVGKAAGPVKTENVAGFELT